jgi:hypothetical protein
VENINFGWFSSGKLVAPKEDNIQLYIKYHSDTASTAENVL